MCDNTFGRAINPLNPFDKKIKITKENEEAVINLQKERDCLAVNINNLFNFIDNTDNKLHLSEWSLLSAQYDAMRALYKILNDRCRLYGIEDNNKLPII